MEHVIWVRKTDKTPKMANRSDGIHLSKRGTLTLPSWVFRYIGSPTAVDIAVIPDKARVIIQPGTQWSVYSRKERSSPQISVLPAIKKMGIESILPGHRDFSVSGKRVLVSLIPY